MACGDTSKATQSVHHLTIHGVHLLCTIELMTSTHTALLATHLRPVLYRTLIMASLRRVHGYRACPWLQGVSVSTRRVRGYNMYIYNSSKYSKVETDSYTLTFQLRSSIQWQPRNSLRQSWLPALFCYASYMVHIAMSSSGTQLSSSDDTESSQGP